jgi:hypothetical protein
MIEQDSDIAGNQPRRQTNTNVSDSMVDLRQLDTLLKELAIIGQKTALYYRFMRQRIQASQPMITCIQD